MPETDIRPLTAGHLPAVKGIIDGVGLFPSELLDDMVAPGLAGTEDALWCVAVADDAAVGVAYGAPERMTDGTWNLLLLAVHPAHQGQGLGRALTWHVEQALAARAARILLVETSGRPDFARTRAVYRRLGYVEEARIRGFYADGDDKVVFWKALGGDAVP